MFKREERTGWLLGDIGDISDGENDTPSINRKKNDNDLLKYLQEAVGKKILKITQECLLPYHQDHQYHQGLFLPWFIPVRTLTTRTCPGIIYLSQLPIQIYH